MTHQEIELGIRNVIATHDLEGLPLSERTIELMRAVANGSLDAKDAIEAFFTESPGDAQKAVRSAD